MTNRFRSLDLDDLDGVQGGSQNGYEDPDPNEFRRGDPVPDPWWWYGGGRERELPPNDPPLDDPPQDDPPREREGGGRY